MGLGPRPNGNRPKKDVSFRERKIHDGLPRGRAHSGQPLDQGHAPFTQVHNSAKGPVFRAHCDVARQRLGIIFFYWESKILSTTKRDNR